MKWIAFGALASVVSVAPVQAKDRSVPAKPAGSPGSWFSDDDYPAEARRANKGGRVAVRVEIDSAGAVTGCSVVESSGTASLDEITCRLVRERAHFIAARDKQGRPIASTYPIATRWVLNLNAVGPTWVSRAVVRIGPGGKLLSCVRTDSIRGIGPSLRTCDSANSASAARLIAARGSNAGDSIVDIITEASMVVDGDPAPPLAFDEPDHVPLALMILNYDIDPTGAVTNCNMVVKVGPDTPACTTPEGPFAPDPQGRTRHVKNTLAISRYIEP